MSHPVEPGSSSVIVVEVVKDHLEKRALIGIKQERQGESNGKQVDGRWTREATRGGYFPYFLEKLQHAEVDTVVVATPLEKPPHHDFQCLAGGPILMNLCRRPAIFEWTEGCHVHSIED